jgi:glycosyltransferase involved in cell wall biosynthesis
MKIGIALEETWSFLHEIYAELQAHHTVSLFKRQVTGLPIFNQRLNDWRFARDLRLFLQQNDVVFFEWASELLAAASHLPKSCAIVTRLHRYEMYQWVDKINWQNVDAIILVSEAKRAEFTARFPQQAPKIVVIPEAVSVEKFAFRPKPWSGDLGTMCHLRPRKRVYETILGFYELCQKQDGFHLHLGGGGAEGFHEYPVALYRLVEKLNLQEKVTFYGNVPNPENWYGKLDLFIANGYSEGLQVSPMEAMAAGTYCISHWWDGADELLPPSHLYYSEREMAELILAYAALPEVEKQAQMAVLRRRVENQFNMAQISSAIRQVIEAAAR